MAGTVNKHGHSLRQAGLRRKLKYPPQREKLQAYLKYFEERGITHSRIDDLRKLLNGYTGWDEIVEIRKIGVHECVDIEVAETHTYLFDGVVSHNSTSLASHGVMIANCIPYFRILYVTPLYEQIRRFSNNYVRTFIDRSPIKSLWSGTNTENSVLQRSFKNLSMMIFSFALMDADRVRGVSCDCINYDEVQDLDPDHMPIIRETMSHSAYGMEKFTGVLAPSFG